MGDLFPRAEHTPDELMDRAIEFVLGPEHRPNDPEDQYDLFVNFVLELGTELGGIWGYGHLGNDPRKWATWGLVGEAEWETPFEPDGVPSLHRALFEKFQERYA